MPTQPERRSARAADWLFRLRNPDVTPEEIRDWLAWCEADPKNKQEFARMQAVWQQTAVMDTPPSDIAALVSRDAAPASRWGSVANSWSSAHRGRWLVAASVAALATLGVGWWVTQHGQGGNVSLTTTAGVNRDVVLPDGSQISLAAGSRLFTQYTEAERRVILEQGEAFFSVEKDPRRPFVVRALDATVTAVGTAFNVRAQQGLISVAVTEGTVDVERSGRNESVRVAAGHEITLSSSGGGPVFKTVSAERVTAWREGILQYEREPLASVVATVNRYADAPIVLDDEALGRLHFTGTVAVDRIDEWVHGLQDIYPVTVRDEAGSRIVIEPRP